MASSAEDLIGALPPSATLEQFLSAVATVAELKPISDTVKAWTEKLNKEDVRTLNQLLLLQAQDFQELGFSKLALRSLERCLEIWKPISTGSKPQLTKSSEGDQKKAKLIAAEKLEKKEKKKKDKAAKKEKKKKKDESPEEALGREIGLVQETWRHSLPVAATVGKIFYKRLFEVDTNVAKLFRLDITEQEIKLVRMLDYLVNNLNDLSRIVPDVQALAVRHVAYGVRSEHYRLVGETLLWTLEKVLGNQFAGDVKAAWVHVYTIVADAMISASAPYEKSAGPGEEDKIVMQTSWEAITHPDPVIVSRRRLDEKAAEVFYKKLFELRPDIKYLFHNGLESQGLKLFKMLSSMIQHKDHLGDIPANAMAFGMFSGTGTRHSYYSVKPEHFAPMLESLVWTFRQLLGDKYTDRTKVAWSKAFQSCASVMKKAMEEARQSGTPEQKQVMLDDVVAVRLDAIAASNGTVLSLRNYQLTFLPPAIFSLTQLTQIDLEMNNLVQLPETMSVLIHLQDLIMASNKLISLPPSLGGFSSLQRLDLSKNWLTDLPLEIAKLTNLRQLIVADNKLISLCPAIGLLTNLNILDIGNNMLNDLPDSLGALTSLSKLTMEGNPLKKLPANVRKGSFDGILSYLRENQKGGAVKSNRVKLAIIGAEGVGKSSLLGQLKKKPRAVNVSTEGIEFSDWEADGVVFHCMDFGGQEVFYSNHTLFISARTMYVLVFNMEDADQSKKAIRYWLSTIQAIAPGAPMILVGSHLDSAKINLVLDDAKQLVEQHFAANNVASAVMAGYFAVSNTKGLGIERLRERLIKVAKEQKFFNELLPKSYVQLEQMILAARNVPTPPLMGLREQFAKLCAKVGIDDPRALAQFMHSTGVVLYLSEHLWPNEQVIIDPTWLARVMACVVTFAHNLGKRTGILAMKDLQQLWQKYPAHIHSTLLYYLEHYQVLLQVDIGGARRIMIPAYLPEAPQISLESLWPRQQAPNRELARQYVFDFVPHGFFSRCMVSLLPLAGALGTGATFWKSGIHWRIDTSEGLVQFSATQHTLYVNVRGPKSAFLMQAISGAVDRLTAALFKSIRPKQFVDLLPALAQLRGPAVHTDPTNVPLSNPTTATSTPIPSWRLVPFAKLELLVVQGQETYQFDPPADSSTKILNPLLIPLDWLIPEITLVDLPRFKSGEVQFDDRNKIAETPISLLRVGRWQDQLVAVKVHKIDSQVFHVQPESLREIAAAFRQEAWNMALHTHPNIVRFLGVDPKRRALVSEYIAHGSLYAYLRRNQRGVVPIHTSSTTSLSPASAVHSSTASSPPVVTRARSNSATSGLRESGSGTIRYNWPLALRIALDGAKALAYLHSLCPPVVHGDVKSPNVLLACDDPNAKAAVAKLADFGLMRRSSAIQLESVSLNPTWLAPEVTLQRRLTTQSDVYAFGVILWELITRQHPFSEYKQLTCRDVIAGKRPSIPVNTPQPYSALIQKCWNNEPDLRPVMSDVALALAECVQLSPQWVPINSLITIPSLQSDLPVATVLYSYHTPEEQLEP